MYTDCGLVARIATLQIEIAYHQERQNVSEVARLQEMLDWYNSQVSIECYRAMHTAFLAFLFWIDQSEMRPEIRLAWGRRLQRDLTIIETAARRN